MPGTTDNRQAILKTSFFGGFDKREVLSYIDSLREENAAAQTSLDRELQEVTAARNELSAQIGGFQKKLSEMEQQLSERTARADQMTDRVKDLEQRLTESKKETDKAGLALRLQEEQNRVLSERVQRSEEKAQRYVEVSEQLGDILLSARHEADTVVSRALGEAERIRGDVAATGKRMSESLSDMKADLEEMRAQMIELSERLSLRVAEIEAILEWIDPAVPKAPVPQPAGLPPEESPDPQPEEAQEEPAAPVQRTAVSQAAQRVRDAADAMREERPRRAGGSRRSGLFGRSHPRR